MDSPIGANHSIPSKLISLGAWQSRQNLFNDQVANYLLQHVLAYLKVGFLGHMLEWYKETQLALFRVRSVLISPGGEDSQLWPSLWTNKSNDKMVQCTFTLLSNKRLEKKI